MKKLTEDKSTPEGLRIKKNRQQSDVPLTKLQEALRNAQAEAKRERRARIKAEKALIDAQEELAAIRRGVNRDYPLQIRHISFVVRLTLDRLGRFGRTEIEHVSSSRKQNFLKLDGERLVHFMKTCINQRHSSGETPPQAD